MSSIAINPKYSKGVVHASISISQLRKDLEAELKPYGINVDQFLKSDLEDYSDANLRDLWLMSKGLLEPSK